MALDAAIKFMVLKVRNESGRFRKLSATGYVEWVLGDLRPKTTMHVVTEIDPASGALLAWNPYNTEFAERTAFFAVDEMKRTVTGDRRGISRTQRLAAHACRHDAYPPLR